MNCIVFNWHGEAPSDEAAQQFGDYATEALIEIAEQFGCQIGGGFQVVSDPCNECAKLAECPFGHECVTCNPPTQATGVVHMKRPTVTGMS